MQKVHLFYLYTDYIIYILIYIYIISFFLLFFSFAAFSPFFPFFRRAVFSPLFRRLIKTGSQFFRLFFPGRFPFAFYPYALLHFLHFPHFQSTASPCIQHGFNNRQSCYLKKLASPAILSATSNSSAFIYFLRVMSDEWPVIFMISKMSIPERYIKVAPVRLAVWV